MTENYLKVTKEERELIYKIRTLGRYEKIEISINSENQKIIQITKHERFTLDKENNMLK